MTLFLDDPAATHLLFIDADIGFTPQHVFRLIESGADVVAGCYPIKQGQLGQGETRGGLGPTRDRGRPRSITCSSSTIRTRSRFFNGFTRVRYAGTGFLMIRRHVLEKMCAHPGLRAAAVPARAFARRAGRQSRTASRLFECVIDTGHRHLPQRGFCLLQALDRYRRRDLGRS